MELGREPYQTELDDAVEKEIAAVVQKNEERKKRKGAQGAVNVDTAVNKDIEDRLLLLEDSIEKWDEKMDFMGSMLSKLYEAQFGKSASTVHEDDDEKRSPFSEKVNSEYSEDSEDSGGENASKKSTNDADSSDGRSSDEDVDNSAGKSTDEQHAPGKLKGKEVQEGVGEGVVASIAAGGAEAGSIAGPKGRGRSGVTTSKKSTKVRSMNQ